jgi:hypothetical protein
VYLSPEERAPGGPSFHRPRTGTKSYACVPGSLPHDLKSLPPERTPPGRAELRGSLAFNVEDCEEGAEGRRRHFCQDASRVSPRHVPAGARPGCRCGAGTPLAAVAAWSSAGRGRTGATSAVPVLLRKGKHGTGTYGAPDGSGSGVPALNLAKRSTSAVARGSSGMPSRNF